MRRYKRIFIGILLVIIGSFLFFKLTFYPPILLYRLSEFNPEAFLSHIKFIRENNFRITSLEELAQAFNRKNTGKSLAIAFEGLNKDVLELVKIAKELNLSLVLFVDKESLKNSSLNLKDILRNCPLEIGILCDKELGELSSFQLQKEVFLPKRFIEEFLGKKIKYIAFKLGKPNREVLRAIKNTGYLCGLNLDRLGGGSIFSLKPIRITPQDSKELLREKISGFYYLFGRDKAR